MDHNIGIDIEAINGVFNRMLGPSKALELSKDDVINAMSSIYTPGPSYYAIFNFETNQVEYVSPDIKKVLGLDPSQKDLEQILDLFHKDDIKHFITCLEIGEVFYNEILKSEEKPYYKCSYQYRVRDHHGNYKLILHQSVLIYNSNNEYTGKAFIWATDIGKFTSTRREGISIIDNRGLRSFLNITSVSDLHTKASPFIELSEREREILRLVSEGYKSKEIASKLNISYKTVRTHRNNILRKGQYKSLSQALAFYIKQGAL